MQRRAAWLVSVALLLASARLGAQTAVRAPGGVLTGVVQDSATGLPVGYALLILVESDQRVFASEGGRFSLAGLSSGPATLRVQQIGYRAIIIRLTVDTRGSPTSSPGILVLLSRQAFVLPEIVVQGDLCAGASGGAVLDEAFKNAERLLTLEKSYPYQGAFQRVTTILDSLKERVTGWVDTVRYDTRQSVGYKRGKVLTVIPRKDLPGKRQDQETANYFQTSDLAREEFRKHHCFWFAGADSVAGFPGYRIDFAPTGNVKTADWAGSLLIDSASMVLLRSEAHLVNLPKQGTSFGAASCTVLYKQLVPTLVHEFQAHCVTSQTSKPPAYVIEQWVLIEHLFTFIGRSPVEVPRPPGEQGGDSSPPRQPLSPRHP